MLLTPCWLIHFLVILVPNWKQLVVTNRHRDELRQIMRNESMTTTHFDNASGIVVMNQNIKIDKPFNIEGDESKHNKKQQALEQLTKTLQKWKQNDRRDKDLYKTIQSFILLARCLPCSCCSHPKASFGGKFGVRMTSVCLYKCSKLISFEIPNDLPLRLNSASAASQRCIPSGGNNSCDWEVASNCMPPRKISISAWFRNTICFLVL